MLGAQNHFTRSTLYFSHNGSFVLYLECNYKALLCSKMSAHAREMDIV